MWSQIADAFAFLQSVEIDINASSCFSKLVDAPVFSISASASVLQLDHKIAKYCSTTKQDHWTILDCCFEELVSLIPALMLALKPGDVAWPCKNIPESAFKQRSQKRCALGPRFAWTFVLHPGRISRNHAALT